MAMACSIPGEDLNGDGRMRDEDVGTSLVALDPGSATTWPWTSIPVPGAGARLLYVTVARPESGRHGRYFSATDDAGDACNVAR